MAEGQKLGYDDTPYISGTSWRVHDDDRPEAPVITPGTASTEAAAGAPPSDAVVHRLVGLPP